MLKNVVLYYVNFEVINMDLVGLSYAMHAVTLPIVMQVSVLFLYFHKFCYHSGIVFVSIR